MPVIGDFYYFLHPSSDSCRPPLVLIHGPGGSHLSWPPELRRLPGHRVYSIDLPGHGRSGGVGRQSVSDYAVNVSDFLLAVGIVRAVVVGHSLGGAIALQLALEFPSQLAGICLLGTAARFQVNPEILTNGANPATARLAFQAAGRDLFHPGADPRQVAAYLRLLSTCRPAVLTGDYAACAAFDPGIRLGRIKLPVLVLTAEEDRLVSPVRMGELVRAIPDAWQQMIPSAGHMAALEQPRRVAGAVRLFVDRLQYTPGA